ncbi:MAG: hypothetical protein ACKOX3_03480 [Bacteroidota bacterium]
MAKQIQLSRNWINYSVEKRSKALKLLNDFGLFRRTPLSTSFKGLYVSILFLLVSIASFGQVTTNGGSGLQTTYSSLADAITALNAATISSPVEIKLNANQTAPSTGFVITASGTSTNTITLIGNGNTVTAGTGYSAGSYTDGIFKLI